MKLSTFTLIFFTACIIIGFASKCGFIEQDFKCLNSLDSIIIVKDSIELEYATIYAIALHNQELYKELETKHTILGFQFDSLERIKRDTIFLKGIDNHVIFDTCNCLKSDSLLYEILQYKLSH